MCQKQKKVTALTVYRCNYHYYYYYYYTHLTASFQDNLGKPGKTSLDLNEAREDGVLGWQWHQVDQMQTICISFQIDNHINTPLLLFYRPGALPDAQTTALKH